MKFPLATKMSHAIFVYNRQNGQDDDDDVPERLFPDEVPHSASPPRTPEELPKFFSSPQGADWADPKPETEPKRRGRKRKLRLHSNDPVRSFFTEASGTMFR